MCCGYLLAIVVRILKEDVNRVVLTIVTDQLVHGAASSTKLELSIGDAAELVPGTRRHIEERHRSRA